MARDCLPFRSVDVHILFSGFCIAQYLPFSVVLRDILIFFLSFFYIVLFVLFTILFTTSIPSNFVLITRCKDIIYNGKRNRKSGLVSFFVFLWKSLHEKCFIRIMWNNAILFLSSCLHFFFFFFLLNKDLSFSRNFFCLRYSMFAW